MPPNPPVTFVLYARVCVCARVRARSRARVRMRACVCVCMLTLVDEIRLYIDDRYYSYYCPNDTILEGSHNGVL